MIGRAIYGIVSQFYQSKRFSTYSMRTKPGEAWLADLGIAEKARQILIVRELTACIRMLLSRSCLPFKKKSITQRARRSRR